VGGWVAVADDIESNDRDNIKKINVGSGPGLANGVIQIHSVELKASFSQTLTTLLRVVTTKTKPKPNPEASQPTAVCTRGAACMLEPDRYCSTRHKMPLAQQNEGSICVEWREINTCHARPRVD